MEFLNSDDNCRMLAQKYNELRKNRISSDSTGADRASNQLAEVELSIQNILRTFEQGAVSDTLVQKLEHREDQKSFLSEKVKVLTGTDQDHIYITPVVIKEDSRRYRTF